MIPISFSVISKTPGLLRLAVIHFLLQAQFWFPIWVTFLQDRNFSLTMIVAADAWFRVVMVLLEFPLGVLGDLIGRRRTFLLAGLFACATYFTFIFLETVPLLFLAWTVWATVMVVAAE